MSKLDYSQSYRKKEVQNIVFSEAKQTLGYKKLIGLAGPNITDYLSFVKKMGIKEAEVYENNYTHMLYQMGNFKPPINTTVKFQDVYSAPLYQDVIYDLDFCCTIINAHKHIRKFNKSKSVITLSLRGVGLMPTIKKFCKLVRNIGKPIIKLNVLITPNYKKHIINYENAMYTLYEYRDTSSMLTIINF